MITGERIHSNAMLGKTERKKIWHKEILGKFSLFVTAYSVKCVDLKKEDFVMYGIKYQK